MTVKECRELLSRFGDDVPLALDGYEYGYAVLDSFNLIELAPGDDDGHPYGGDLRERGNGTMYLVFRASQAGR